MKVFFFIFFIPLLSSQVFWPQSPPQKTALMNARGDFLKRKDMGGPPEVQPELFPLAAVLRKYTTLSRPLRSRNPQLSKNLPLNPIYSHIPQNLQPILPSSYGFTLPLCLVHLSLEHVIVLPVSPN